MYEMCRVVMEKTLEFDADGDGLIENSNTADQTYGDLNLKFKNSLIIFEYFLDTWVMSGASAYCGSLFLASLQVMTKMANFLGKNEEAKKFTEILERGKKSFEEKLWNGKFYNFDENSSSKTIMSDQLCGHWYLHTCGLNDYEVFKKENVRVALKTIFEQNVMNFCDGQMGAVNGFSVENGSADTSIMQAEEIWVGVVYALASTMIYEEMQEEAMKCVEGLYHAMTQRIGLAFETPEAMYGKNNYRSIGYMRPLSIWSMQTAIESRKRKGGKNS